jgi:CheY-like chemotaxis protein
MQRILVADDNGTVRSFLESLLTGEGYEVVLAVDGKEAVRAFRARRPDLVVLDVFMPRMSGLDALLDMDPAKTFVPVIAISGSGSRTGADPLALAASLGASRTFAKPFDVPEFLDAVRELLAGAGR